MMKNLRAKSRRLIAFSIAALVPLSGFALPRLALGQEISISEEPSISQTVNTNLIPPANDNFASAQVLPGCCSNISASTVDATKEVGEPSHAGNSGGHSIWYSWTSGVGYASGQTFTVRDATTNFDTLLAVYTGASVNALTLIASNDDYGSTPTIRTSTVYFQAAPATTYYIAVDGWSAQSGNIRLTWDINRTHATSSQFAGTSQSVVSVFRPSNGRWYVNAFVSGFQSVQWGLNGDIPVPADYDGDEVTDYAVFRPGNGTWYVLTSRTGAIQSQLFGQSGDKPVPGDYNGNGFADFAVFRPSNGTWYMLDNGFRAVQFGQSGDKPVPVDFDADGKLDLTVFRPSNGTWYILNSRDNSFMALPFGTSEDIPVPGGYSSTGRANIAVWRPSNGTWYVYSLIFGTVITRQFGQSGDIPQPIDYGSNVGLSDFGIFRPSNGTWYIQDIGGNFSAIQFGQNADIPTATAYTVP